MGAGGGWWAGVWPRQSVAEKSTDEKRRLWRKRRTPIRAAMWREPDSQPSFPVSVPPPRARKSKDLVALKEWAFVLDCIGQSDHCGVEFEIEVFRVGGETAN
jgi:hypothetical protein